jgi:hypothetical protein
MREEVGGASRQVGEREAKIEGLHREVKRAMADKNEKEGLIKSKKFILI